MRWLYRVFSFDPSTASHEPGGALFVPESSRGRIDNPKLYRALYVSSHPEGAVAETLGRLPFWRDSDCLDGENRRFALATYELTETAQIFDLDNLTELAALGIQHPREVVTRERLVTQTWARKIFELRRHAGVSWWCYYNPDWSSIGLWDTSLLSLHDTPQPIGIASDVVASAATAIVRQRDLSMK